VTAYQRTRAKYSAWRHVDSSTGALLELVGPSPRRNRLSCSVSASALATAQRAAAAREISAKRSLTTYDH
jgi:hypothetical protein